MIIYGKNTCLEAIKNGKKIETIYITKNNLPLIEKYNIKQNKIVISSLNDIDKIAKGNHQGIVVKTVDYEYKSLKSVIEKNKDKTNVSLCLLDGLEDPHNLGAILRSADAAMIDAIIIPKNRSVGLTDVVAKVSTGAIEYVDICEEVNLNNTIKVLKDVGYWVIGVELGGSIDYRKQDYSGKIAVVIGSEGKGISRLVKENCDFLVHIPMYGHVNSLNASVSSALIFYEILKVKEK